MLFRLHFMTADRQIPGHWVICSYRFLPHFVGLCERFASEANSRNLKGQILASSYCCDLANVAKPIWSNNDLRDVKRLLIKGKLGTNRRKTGENLEKTILEETLEEQNKLESWMKLSKN